LWSDSFVDCPDSAAGEGVIADKIKKNPEKRKQRIVRMA
jgi:hypothetical protein